MVPVLVVAFIAVPLIELFVIIQVGQVLGIVPTIALLLAESLLGAWLVKREGARAWTALRRAIGTARMPDTELADAALILVGGTLLLTPGFLTDVVGFALVLPFTRPLGRRLLRWLIARRVTSAVAMRTGAHLRGAGRFNRGARGGQGLIHGEVLRDEPGDPPDMRRS